MGGELALRRGDELVAALPGVAAQGPPHLLDVALAHFVSLPTMLRAASVSRAREPLDGLENLRQLRRPPE